MPSMERYGLWFLKRLRKKYPPDRVDRKIHILDNEERAQINKIEKRAILNVTIAGVISSIISGQEDNNTTRIEIRTINRLKFTFLIIILIIHTKLQF